MKFLAIAKQKDSLMTLPPATIRQLLETSWTAMKHQKAQGKIVDYFYSPLRCTVVVVDYPSTEEWVKDQAAIPILAYYDQEIYPLSEAEPAIEGLLEGLKAAGG